MEKVNFRIVIQSNYAPGQERRYRDLVGMSFVIRIPDGIPIDELRVTEIAQTLKRQMERQARKVEGDLVEQAYAE